jgi:outer membrane receptor protein involved in Fe transport
MSFPKVKIILVFLALAMLALSGFAQTRTTGSIAGVVHDPSGAAVPGAVVTATSENLIRPQSATTSGDGSYQILNLPPGKYTITISEAKGFAKFEQREIDVALTRVSAVDVRLQLATAQAEVTVVEGAAQIDVVTTTAGSNVSTDQFSNFPTQRTVQGLYNIAPGVSRSGLRDATGRDRDPSVAGSSGPENNYILDGVNTSDPAYGGSGANLPFEFVQEVQIMTNSYSAEYGKSTGGVFNVVTKSGGNDFHGDAFGYFTGQDLVRKVKNFPFTGAAGNGFSEKDIGVDLGGPIVKNKIWFFGAANPQWRSNYFLTQTFHAPVKNDVTIPFYAGKVTWAINNNNTFTFSTFGDYTTVDGFLATYGISGNLSNINGFGNDKTAFLGKSETGGRNYAFRLNSAITPTWVAEITAGISLQRSNQIPQAVDQPLINDNFAVLKGDNVLDVTQSGVLTTANSGKTGHVDYVDGRGGSLQRNYLRGSGFGLYDNSERKRFEYTAHLQNSWKRNEFKYGVEWSRNIYNDVNISSGAGRTYSNINNYPMIDSNNNQTDHQRIYNKYGVCTVRGSQITCPSATYTAILAALPAGKLPAGLTLGPTATISTAEAFGNPFLVRLTTQVRDYQIHAKTHTDVRSAYLQDNLKLTKDVQVNLGLRWDFQTAFGPDSTYLKLNQFVPAMAPRLGVIWDFTGKGKGKFFANWAHFVEAPIPLDLNVRSSGGDSQIDRNFNVDTLNAPAGSVITPGYSGSYAAVNLGASLTPVDPDVRPPTLTEWATGFEYEPVRNLVVGVRGIYRNYVWIIEDGSFDDGNNYFLFNPGRKVTSNLNDPRATTEDKACGDPTIGCFGKARRYYRAIEFTANKRFSNRYQFMASYTYSSLEGNYEGLFRNDNGQSDPNITSLFDLVSLLSNTYGRLPNDKPHQFKLNGTYQTPFKLMISGNFYVQSGQPFNMMVPHPVYGNNEGFGMPRGTAVVPKITVGDPNFPNYVESTGTTRSPVTSTTDLGFYYPIKLKSEKRELRLTADWFNIFNQQRAVSLDQTYSLNSGVSGIPPVPNPFWGAALIVQPPSQWRFGAKFSF